MKSRFKKIKHLFQLYGVLKTISLIIAFGLVLFLYNKYVAFDEYIETISSDIVSVVEYENFSNNTELKEVLKDEKLYAKRDSVIKLMKKSKKNIITIADKEQIDDIQFTENINALLDDYEAVIAQNKLFFSYIINIGDFNNGLYSKMKKAEASFLAKLNTYKLKKEVESKFKLLDHSIELLLENKSVVILNDIQTQLDELENLIEKKLLFTDDYSKIRAKDQFLYFKASFHELTKQISAIGFGDNIGLIARMNVNYTKINKRLKIFQDRIKEQKHALILYTGLIMVVLILVSLLLSIFLSYFLNVLINSTLYELKQRAIRLPEGDLPKVVLDDYIEESHQFFELLDEYEKQISTSRKLIKSFTAQNILPRNKYEEANSIFKKELVDVRDKFEELQTSLKDEVVKTENVFWMNEGISQISNILRSKYEDSILHSDELIIHLVNFLDVPIGAIYSVDNETIEMKANVAYGETKTVNKHLIFGEGIVGTAAAEQRTILLTSVPDDYFEVISGFGSSKPKSILVSPIKLNDTVFGIIELASLDKFADREIDFVKEVANTIAYSFAVSKFSNENLIKIDNMNVEIAQLKTENVTLSNDYAELDLNYRQMHDKLKNDRALVESVNGASMILNINMEGDLLTYNKHFEHFFRLINKSLMQDDEKTGIKRFHYNIKHYLYQTNKSSNFDVDIIWKNLKSGVQYSIVHDMLIFDKVYTFFTIFIPIKEEENDAPNEIKMIMFSLKTRNADAEN